MSSDYKVKTFPADFRQVLKKDFDPDVHWYVYVEYVDPATGKTKQRRIKRGINFERKLETRKEHLSALLAATKLRIEQGWNPVTGKEDPILTDEGEDLKSMGLADALAFVLGKKTLAPKSAQAYAKAVDCFIKSATRLRLSHRPPAEIKRADIMIIMDGWQRHDKASDKTYNKYLSFIKSLFTDMIDWGLVEYNAAHTLRNKKVTGQRPFKQPETEEKGVIYNHLKAVDPDFLNFVLAVYHTGARPEELLSIRVRDVKLNSRLIEFAPDITKPETLKRLPISRELMDVFNGMRLDKADPEHFVFGSQYTKPNGYRGRNKNGDKLKMFVPAPGKVRRDMATKLWARYVRKGLGIDAHLYGMKHRGGNDKLRGGVNPQAIQYLYGHSSEAMTRRYAFDINDEYRRQITEQSPGFLE